MNGRSAAFIGLYLIVIDLLRYLFGIFRRVCGRVLGYIYENRSRTSGGRDLKRPSYGRGDVFRLLYKEAVLGYRHSYAYYIHLLE